MRESELLLANTMLENAEFKKLLDFLEPFLKQDDGDAILLSRQFGLDEWNESAEEFEERRLKCLKKAAAQEHPEALYSLSALYLNGEHVELDIELGKAYLDRSLELGFDKAMVAVAGY
ncbi:sel1 repeat family protein [Glaciecola sp. MH2013]|uniref:sel1 repeat family protein n=1 Tax=Glaciecola sp. MH2013 TaxID=2785524 RepID=UPI00189DC9F5|nr:sel1 repeat family protein [Glaciecola sp. MH2013]MBF7073971.1 sel1 repeat family protein [Glaciecola sp. MH2013]